MPPCFEDHARRLYHLAFDIALTDMFDAWFGGCNAVIQLGKKALIP